jgi:hypothetical protein
VIHQYLETVGIPSHLPAAEKAVALVRAFPLSVQSDEGQRDVGTILDSGWFAGAGECIRVLAEVYRGSTGRGAAFGQRWPYLSGGGRVLAPAVPVLVSEEEVSGPDGSYQVRDQIVWRETVSQPRPLLRMDGTVENSGPGFDLLWFGDNERFLVGNGLLEIEDLFSLTRLPLTHDLLDHFLSRVLRLDRALVGDLEMEAGDTRPTIEVRRLREMVPNDRWRDPCRLFAARVGIRRVDRDGERLVVETERPQQVVFSIVEERNGWRAFAWEGTFPFQSLVLLERGEVLSLTGTLSREIDPRERGLRGRLAFDLNADLVALTKD